VSDEPEASTGRETFDGSDSETAPAWEIWLAWALRALILATATYHLYLGDLLYSLLCLAALMLMVAPPLLAHTSRLNIPVEIELFVLWWLVTDMTLGRMLDLYEAVPLYDKIIHFGNSGLLALLSFLAIYTLRMTCRIQTGFFLNVSGIFLLTLGAGALWEILEFASDALFRQGAQGSPLMAPLEDTMWDLIVDGLGGLIGGLLGAWYMRVSGRSAARWKSFMALAS
jgi:hypothetical protein